MTYADYEYYKTTGGKIPESEYAGYAMKASDYINYVTFDRVTDDLITDKIRNCHCTLVDGLYVSQPPINAGTDAGTIRTGLIKAEQSRNWRVEYDTSASVTTVKTTEERSAELYGICRMYLTRPINYMYLGAGGL